jgi:hypothetical protein
MSVFRSPIVLFIGIALIVSCARRVERQVVDYQDSKTIELPAWECHQVYSIRRDSGAGDSARFLEIVSFPKKEYPGFSIDWLNGDWSAFTSLWINARIRGSGPTRFFLSVWDGKGTYDFNNRFQKEFTLDTGWTNCDLPIQAGLIKPNGKETNVRHISSVVFFTTKQDSLTIFDVKTTSLQ